MNEKIVIASPILVRSTLLCSCIFCIYLTGLGIRQYYDKQDYIMMIVSMGVTIFFFIITRILIKETFAIMFRKEALQNETIN